jgi:hypothetical protein
MTWSDPQCRTILSNKEYASSEDGFPGGVYYVYLILWEFVVYINGQEIASIPYNSSHSVCISTSTIAPNIQNQINIGSKYRTVKFWGNDFTDPYLHAESSDTVDTVVQPMAGCSIINDDQAPLIEYFESGNLFGTVYWTNEASPNISFSCSDNGGRIAKVEIVGLGRDVSMEYPNITTTWKFLGNEKLDDGEYNLVFLVYDASGNRTQKNVTLGVDTKPPESLMMSLDPVVSVWTNKMVTAKCSCSAGNGSPLRGYQYKIGSNEWSTIQISEYSITENCTLQCRAVDVAGNYLENTVEIANIDRTSPVLEFPVWRFSSDGNELFINMDARDEESGIEYCRIEMRSEPGSSVTTFLVNQRMAEGSFVGVIDLGTHRMYGKTPHFTVCAKNSAGDFSQNYSFSCIIPKRISFSVDVIALSQFVGSYITVDLRFGLSVEQVKRFDSLLVRRVLYVSTMDGLLADVVIDPQSIPVSISRTSSPSVNNPWRLDNNDMVVYTDFIPVSSGAGNREWRYFLSASCVSEAGGAGEVWGGIDGSPCAVTFPNNPGTVDMVIRDGFGHIWPSEEFSIGPTGFVEVGFTGSDPDRDDWQVKVQRVKRVEQPGYSFTSYTTLSGKDPILYKYEAGYAEMRVPIHLELGDNNIQLAWIEGGSLEETRSEIRDLVFRRQVDGAYTLEILDEYGNEVSGTGNGVLCSPGQELSFTVSGEAADQVVWDFGDGTGTARGSSQRHTYHQAEGQTTSEVLRTLTLTMPTGAVSIEVTVRDTQQGMLYESEIWRGDHVVVGKLIVPEGMSLRIMGDQTVSFLGDFGAGSSQGILVQGDLIVDGSVKLCAADEQARRWDTIMVQGRAAIGNESGGWVEIRDAERGVTAAPGSSVRLVRTRLRGNETGLHVVGTGEVAVEGCEIVGNALYGIKEDAGGRPEVRDTTLRDNLRNYYSWDDGILSIGRLNERPNNRGNQGE